MSLAELLVVMVLVGMVGTMIMSLSTSTGRLLGRVAERTDESRAARVTLEVVTRALRASADPDGGATLERLAALGTFCDPAGTDGRRCAFVDGTSAFPELRSGPNQIAFFSALYDLSAARAGNRVLYRYFVDGAGDLREWVWVGPYVDPATGALRTPSDCAPGSTNCWPRERVLARGLLAYPAAAPVFTYLNTVQAAAVTTSGDVALVAGGPPAHPNTLTDPTGVNDSPLLQPADIGAGLVNSPGQPRAGLAGVEVWLTFARSTDARRVTVTERVTLPNDSEVVTP
jgi:type II secretory pathway component PulJ